MADIDNTGIVGVASSILIISQLLYFGAAAGLGRNFKKWRHHSAEKRIATIFTLLVMITIGQSLIMFLADKHDDWATAIMTAGPLPILASCISLMIYPLSESSMRWKYRRNNAKWDIHSGNHIPITILCNTWWKWVIYLSATMVTLVVAGFAYSKTKNIYPFLSSLALPVLSTCLGAGIPLYKHIEELQNECRGGCEEDVIIVPIIGHGESTSVIIITYHKKRAGLITIERRQSIIQHTNYSGDDYEVIKSSFRKRFNGGPSEVDEFKIDAKALIGVVAKIGGWFRLSEECFEDRERLREALKSSQVYNGYNTAMYCWTRAIAEASIRVAASRLHQAYDRPEDKSFLSTGDFFGFVCDESQDVRQVVIRDISGNEIPPDDVQRMLTAAKDTRGIFAVAAILLDRMSLSRDSRVPQLMTLAKGYDIRITFKRQSMDDCKVYSKDRQLDNKALEGDLTDISACQKIKNLGGEKYTLLDKASHEIISAEFVPMNWTSFYIHRQHTFMYLLIYMGLSIVFIIFGQAQEDIT